MNKSLAKINYHENLNKQNSHPIQYNQTPTQEKKLYIPPHKKKSHPTQYNKTSCIVSYKNIKPSYGIVLCRRKGEKIQCLLVKMARTYGFSSFAQGKFDVKNYDEVYKMFNDMTYDEKQIILTLDFRNIYKHMWNKKCITVEEENSEKSKYFKANKKFMIFIKHYTKDEITHLIEKTLNPAIQWGIPKGKTKNSYEHGLFTAIREFGEETSIPPSDYTILHNVNLITEDYIDLGVQYINKYFTAYQHNNPQYHPFIKKHQKIEISEIEWKTMDEIEKFGMNESFKQRLITTCMIASNNFNQNIDINYYDIHDTMTNF